MNLKERIFEYLLTIPKGKVVTYQQIAIHLGNKNLARFVGNALHENPNGDIFPCYKVVNSKGKLTKNFVFNGIEEQKIRLEREGIVVNNYTVDLSVYQYQE